MGKKLINIGVKAIFFDMDGVIVDSMPYHYISWYETLIHYGINATAFDIYSREGEKWQRTIKELFERAGKRLNKKTADEIFRRRTVIFNKYFKQHIFAGVPDIIKSLKSKGFLLAIVTGTPVTDLNKILPKSIFKMFDVVVTGDMIKNGKPDPDPYLLAAKMLGLVPKQCIVVENSPNGIVSAKAAGMKCVAITTSLTSEYLEKADMIVDNLSQFIKLI